MKSLFLQMTAFGPFAATQSIHFTDLGDNPLFLINGPTGAGKTSILDAIAFALYGKTTGDRSADAMRCHHAANDVETEVIFIFALADKIYRVDRKPTQTTKAKRGDGLTTRQASANLYQVTAESGHSPLSWPTTLLSSSSVTQANAKVEQLIGLNDSQFRQVVVLPQGQFRELLVANSQSRETILASLFQTETFKRIEEAVT
ncbi:MAG: SMC family ATPase [Aliidiomarina sp.]|uniref:SMC family ATPase n=1 Tax=Aliidiomarina sp. TaxID=1872439 RepID=UPI0025C3FF5A|nr:SMC family ATPase [Aliidiomarina sp.]MCH8500440.1 SMC family ATPase [Aliidiomarina sp.]